MLDHRFGNNDSFYVRTTVADDYGKNLYTTGQLMLDEVYGREINTDGRMSIGTTWVHTFSPTFFNELLAQRPAHRLVRRQLQLRRIETTSTK